MYDQQGALRHQYYTCEFWQAVISHHVPRQAASKLSHGIEDCFHFSRHHSIAGFSYASAMVEVNAHRILGIRSGSSEEEIRRAYRKRCLETHPDKTGSRAEFDRVQTAFLSLSVAEPQRYVVTDDVLLDEMEHEDNMWTLDCRCGDRFVIQEEDVLNDGDVVVCTGCSLAIRVYGVDNTEEEAEVERSCSGRVDNAKDALHDIDATHKDARGAT